jgi:hypothetical protein
MVRVIAGARYPCSNAPWKEHSLIRKHFARALFIVTTLAAVIGIGGVAAFAISNVTAVTVTGPDHQRLTFTLAPGASEIFKLPAANDPIRVDISSPSTNGGVQTPSEVFSALVNADGNGAGMTWIGTNSDGSQKGSSTIFGIHIANLVCGANCVIAWLNVKSVAARTLVLTTNAATSIIRETYVVNIWY